MILTLLLSSRHVLLWFHRFNSNTSKTGAGCIKVWLIFNYSLWQPESCDLEWFNCAKYSQEFYTTSPRSESAGKFNPPLFYAIAQRKKRCQTIHRTLTCWSAIFYDILRDRCVAMENNIPAERHFVVLRRHACYLRSGRFHCNNMTYYVNGHGHENSQYLRKLKGLYSPDIHSVEFYCSHKWKC